MVRQMSQQRRSTSQTTTERKLDMILRIVRDGNCCRVLGPRRTDKSDLMRQAAETLRVDGSHHVAYMTMGDLPFGSADQLFTKIITGVREGLPPSQRPSMPDSIFSPAEFQYALTELVRMGDRNFALFIDDLEIAPPNLVADVLGVMRSAFTDLVDRSGPRFQAIVCGSVSLRKLALHNASSFVGVSKLVVVGDLDAFEREQIVRTLCQQAGVTPMIRGINALLNGTGGDRVLISSVLNVCFQMMKEEGRVRLTPGCIDRGVERFLDEPLPRGIVEPLRQIEGDPELLTATMAILEQGEIAGSQLLLTLDESPSPLEMTGLFQCERDRYRIKSELWKRLLIRRLKPGRLGSLYSLVGDWDRAIDSWRIALRQDEPNIRSSLFIVAVNAIHASKDLDRAFTYLGHVLEACYRGAVVALYLRDEETLELQYQTPGLHATLNRSLPLNDTTYPEIEALQGPEYSLGAMDGEARWLIPLRAEGNVGRTVGLASLLIPDLARTRFRQRDELQDLTAFFNHAALALERKRRDRQMLLTAEARWRKLNSLNSVLASILETEDRNEDFVWCKVLWGLIKQSGLGFSRAALFDLADDGEKLNGRYWVGPLTRTASVEFQVEHNIDDCIRLLRSSSNVQNIAPYESNPIRDLQIDISDPTENLFAYALHRQEMVSSRDGQMILPLPSSFCDRIQPPVEHVVLPLLSGERRLGLLYVDDRFTTALLTADRLELLRTFMGQAVLFVENMRMLDELNHIRARNYLEQTANIATGLIHDISHVLATIPDLIDEFEECFRAGQDYEEPLRDLRAHIYEGEKISETLRKFVVRKKFTPRFVDVDLLLERAVRSAASEKPSHVDVEVTPPSYPGQALVDDQWIELVLKNLLLNAYRAIPPARAGRVNVRANWQPNGLALTVRDNGDGVPPEIQSRIFEPGFTTKARPSILNGIGLYHCRLTVEAHNGTIELNRTKKSGAEFVIFLPVERKINREIGSGGIDAANRAYKADTVS